jgi:hypothetical protein
MSEAKQFLIQSESGEETRWLVTDDELAGLIQSVVVSLHKVHTNGPMPTVSVLLLESGHVIKPGQLALLRTKAWREPRSWQQPKAI